MVNDLELNADDPVADEKIHAQCPPFENPHYYIWCYDEGKKIGNSSQDQKRINRLNKQHRQNTGHSTIVKYQCQ